MFWGHWERSVSSRPYTGTVLSSSSDFCQEIFWFLPHPRNRPPPDLLLFLRRGRQLRSSLQPETQPLAPWKAGWRVHLCLECRVSKEAPVPDSWASERCVGLTLGLFAELLVASREQYPMGSVENKCAVITLGLAGPSSPGLHIISLGFFYWKVIALMV